jgi:hypothetical protein
MSNKYYFLQNITGDVTFLIPEKDFLEDFDLVERKGKTLSYQVAVKKDLTKVYGEQYSDDIDRFWENYTLCSTLSRLPMGDMKDEPIHIIGLYRVEGFD